jgi:hypothetical protein
VLHALCVFSLLFSLTATNLVGSQATRQAARWRYQARKFYRRYVGVSPAEAQRRALNASFASAPKTTLAREYKLNLDQVAYLNVFDKVGCSSLRQSFFLCLFDCLFIRHQTF